MFVHLRLHSEFSIVDGTCRIEDVVKAAAGDGQPALALSDLNNLFGAIKFYKAARGKGLKPVIGSEVWLQGLGSDEAQLSRIVLLVQNRIERAFERDLQGIDLVVGAKGSPLQLILAGVFHLDVPPGNVALADVQALARHPQVAQVIPLSLGDSLQAFRIVGTTPDYVAHYGATLAQGALWSAPMQAVLGAQVAQVTGLGVGQVFAGAHGLGGGGHRHEDTPYTVTGVLQPCGCVLDRLLLTDTASVWAVHEGLAPGEFEDLSADDRSAIEAEREVTLALVRYRTPLAAVSLPRLVNTTTKMQAAAPAVEITRLLSLLGVGTRLLQGLGAVLLTVAGLSVFIALWGAVRERSADIAMLRMLGAPPRRVGALLLLEALWLALLACALALLLSQSLVWLAGDLWSAG